MYDDDVRSFCCILLTFLDNLGEVRCTVRDVNGWPLSTGIRGLEAIRVGRQMCSQKIVLILTTHVANALCSLSMTVRGSSDNTKHED